MVVAKLTGSGNAIQIILENGEVFQTSKGWMTKLLMGQQKGNIIWLTKMPFGVSPDRFKPSPVYEIDGSFKPKTGDNLKPSQDILSPKVKKQKDQQKSYEDKKVW